MVLAVHLFDFDDNGGLCALDIFVLPWGQVYPQETDVTASLRLNPGDSTPFTVDS